jgi:protein SCO1
MCLFMTTIWGKIRQSKIALQKHALQQASPVFKPPVNPAKSTQSAVTFAFTTLVFMSKKTIFYTLFFTVLVLGFYAALSSAIPGFNKKRFPPISKVEPFSFTNQDGKPFTHENMKGKVAVVNYFFTTCTSVCPRMNNNIKSAYETLKENPDVLFLSLTSDPQRDSVAKLKWYADSMKVNTAKWQFLTGRKDSLYKTARYSFKIDDPENFVSAESVDFLHTQFVALVNRKGEVVKIYDGLKPSELASLNDDVKTLLTD